MEGWDVFVATGEEVGSGCDIPGSLDLLLVCLGTALDRAGWLQRFFGRAGVWFFGKWSATDRGSFSFRVRCVLEMDGREKGRPREKGARRRHHTPTPVRDTCSCACRGCKY
jgi:hypothetical protein